MENQVLTVFNHIIGERGSVGSYNGLTLFFAALLCTGILRNLFKFLKLAHNAPNKRTKHIVIGKKYAYNHLMEIFIGNCTTYRNVSLIINEKEN